MTDFSRPFQIMGILNTTPDSFSDGGLYHKKETALEHAQEMIATGVDIIDIGGQSTRPNYQEVPAEIELERVIPLVEAIRKETELPISIDTYFPEVAKAAVIAGATIINDVRGLDTPGMVEVAAAFSEIGLIIMHSRPRRPVSLQEDIQDFYQEKFELCQKHGIVENRICFDPGLGFDKTPEENQQILRNPAAFRFQNFPLLYGISRKRTIGALTGEKNPADRDFGSVAASLFAANQGVEIVRVHNVKGMKQSFDVWKALKLE
ncbi:dihydropteroate synthase [Enterococcus sp. BWB1-3]|uniref:dihydropteroate synthase n=1 Tax=unclassified Enterococcus TaxID=2608891 RepID=UPI0019236774|nr:MULTISPECIES: dihydropteroate synthase [unclassified Enterococcus]MBL1228233.1 dihydropteroate synthase [Enterococcus sp. BWB1-3]MCB5951457.1 dihydropteroate synthase [Enterococcus sp. BWT-B8]MCB5955016.1 dihydropteroate synthase [Enterococcus sp. CWB-B31]